MIQNALFASLISSVLFLFSVLIFQRLDSYHDQEKLKSEEESICNSLCLYALG